MASGVDRFSCPVAFYISCDLAVPFSCCIIYHNHNSHCLYLKYGAGNGLEHKRRLMIPIVEEKAFV